ncbi:MAG: XTP/dITP diphosphatase [Clostridia bacterium]|nr:XTP/dITP diphosphatase [Clostridia bacterium]
MRTIVIASNNQKKLAEFKHIFDSNEYRILSLKDVGFVGDIEENADTFEGNSLIKALAVSEFTGYTAIADDSGLEVDALGGAPGVYSARYAGEGASSKQLIEKLLYEMSEVEDDNRTARFVSVMCAVFPNGERLFARGECEGMILRREAGDNDFGYDPVFFYKPYGKSFAEMTAEEKNSISHRARATFALLEQLKDVPEGYFESPVSKA